MYNLTRSQEIIFTDQRRRTKFPILAPDKIPLLLRVQTVRILGVTFTSSLSVTLHVRSVIAACAQTLYALRVLRKHGLCNDSLHDVFRAVAVAKLMYASNAWWGFSNANDRQKIVAFIRRCIRTGFCSPDLADFHNLYISSDEKLFSKILTCPNHILRTHLPPPTAQNYSLRSRPHNRKLPDRISRITECNFTVRMLYRNIYWLLYILDLCFVFFILVYHCSLTVRNKQVCCMLCYGCWLGAVGRAAGSADGVLEPRDEDARATERERGAGHSLDGTEGQGCGPDERREWRVSEAEAGKRTTGVVEGGDRGRSCRQSRPQAKVHTHLMHSFHSCQHLC